MPLPPGGAPSGGGDGASLMRMMQGKMSPKGGMQPDQLAAGGGEEATEGGPLQEVLALIETAPPEALQQIKEAVDAKLAASSGPPTDSVPSAKSAPGNTPY